MARGPGTDWVAGPTQRKRVQASLNDEVSQNTTSERPGLEQRNIVTTVLRAANPRSGPMSGGREIWLEMENLPATFTLYAKFGDRVAATVSSTFHSFCSSNLHVRRFGIRLRYHVCFPAQFTQVVCRSHYPGQPILELLNMGRAWRNLNTLPITPRCESGYSSSLRLINCFHSIPILLRMEEKGRPEYTPTIRTIVRMLKEGRPPQDSDNSQAEQIESSILEW